MTLSNGRKRYVHKYSKSVISVNHDLWKSIYFATLTASSNWMERSFEAPSEPMVTP